MNLPRLVLCWLVPLLPVLVAEVISYKWMNPTVKEVYIYPTLPQPVADATFQPTPEKFEEVRQMLVCSDGWLGKIGSEGSVAVQLAWVEWNDTDTRCTLEAFRHKPEVCMDAQGMKLEQSYPHRIYGSRDKQFVFDSTLFRSLRGGPALHIFKAVWVRGW